jgi:pimeloyl-ACP methyl ester carboxylesterase
MIDPSNPDFDPRGDEYMTPKPTLNSGFVTRDGVRLAYFEARPADPLGPPLLLVNGWTGDHRIFSPQIDHFACRHRVVAMDLRGHGASDAPKDGYTAPGFSDDIASLAEQLELHKPVVIGHSMGGMISLDLCGRYPNLAAGLVMIDSIILPKPEAVASPDLFRLLEGIGGPDYLAVSRANAWQIGCDYDDPARRQAIFDTYIRPPCEATPQHVALSTMTNMLGYDATLMAAACRIPMAYISADVPLVAMIRDLDHLQRLCPQLVIGKTLLAGHFNTIEVADQVNAMIERFIAVGLSRRADS